MLSTGDRGMSETHVAWPCPPPSPQSSRTPASLPVVLRAGECVSGFLGGRWRPGCPPQEHHVSQGDMWNSGFKSLVGVGGQSWGSARHRCRGRRL